MTFILTPQRKAFNINESNTFNVNCCHCPPPKNYMWVDYYFVETTTILGSEWFMISPLFKVTDYMNPDITWDDAKDTAMYEAVCWLEDLLIRLYDKPKVLHCTDDGEIFVRK